MNDDLKAGSEQGDASSSFDFAGVADREERERLLMEELRRTQRALAEAENEIKQKQRALAEHAFEQEAADARDLLHAACWTADFDDEGNPMGFWFSDGCRRVLGFESEDDFPENGENPDRFIAPDDLARINNEFRIAATEGGPYDVNYCVRRKDGKRMWVRAAAKFRRDEQGIARSCMGVLVDIDDAVKNQACQQQALEQALERADRANKVKTDFLHRMSHDMRTPLNCILGLLELCERNRDDKALVEENHGKMRTAARHLLSLIDDTLQASKLGEGELALVREPVDFAHLQADVDDIMQLLAAEAGVIMEGRQEDSIAYRYVLGNELYLRQIFLNIYSNCIKYNRPGGKVITHVTSSELPDGKVLLCWEITDTGIGMSPEFLKRVFEPFARESSVAGAVGGTGLGMPIVKQLIELMGGSIDISSELNEGSTFVISIPFDPAPAPRETEQAASGSTLQGRRLLLVEDNDLNAEIAATILEGDGAYVSIVGDGAQAVEAFAANPAGTFDAILMDVAMPKMDGLAATRAIRALDRPDAASIPIIAMTGNAFQEDVRECLEAGMNAHIAKPIDMAKAERVITKVVGEGPPPIKELGIDQ
ncbi:ATP-binding protein [uncultured Senegalimassilia sp.]|uniref:PAS domain-containing hybrid sensor histidine kinase/response regulator n=1 Tax=uncultured Senegalimassilia sp. TaxID=1714350 RepID=UPI002623423D|nr:ATP-binding protein [uncultured Senegalimassilia sp.]